MVIEFIATYLIAGVIMTAISRSLSPGDKLELSTLLTMVLSWPIGLLIWITGLIGLSDEKFWQIKL